MVTEPCVAAVSAATTAAVAAVRLISAVVAAFKAVVAAVMFARTAGLAKIAESKFVYRTFVLKPPAATYAPRDAIPASLAEARAAAAAASIAA